MALFGEQTIARRRKNAGSLAAFGVSVPPNAADAVFRTVRGGNGACLFTVGYERRDGDELISLLVDAGIDILVDVRDRPFSRRPDFRKEALRTRCLQADIDYRSWPELGSTPAQREALSDTQDLRTFMSRYRAFARRHRQDDVEKLAKLASKKSIALLCYERVHEECHRMVVADMVAEQIDATIVAIC